MRETADERRRKARVARLEDESRQSPAAYRRRVALLAALGYGVLGALALLGLGLPVLAIGAMFATGQAWDVQAVVATLLLLMLGAGVLRALWVPVAPPPGYRLWADHVPELAAEIERLRREAGAPPLDGVVIDSELNAAAVTCPRAFGLLGERRYLVLGLPLLRLLDRDELLAVIAHEFGHFRSGNGRFMAWIYRLRLRWWRMAEAVATSGLLSPLLLSRFFAWYAPHFDAVSFVLAREEEFEADAVARRLVGHGPLASGLIRLEHASAWLDKHLMRPMADRVRAQPKPPLSISAEQARLLRELPPLDVARVIAAGEREHDVDDTHPVLSRRLAAGEGAPEVVGSGTPAAELFSRLVLADIERVVDTQWRERLQVRWAEGHAAAESERRRLVELERDGGPAEADLLAHARLSETLRPEQDPLRVYERVLARLPDNASALFRAGVLRVEAGDADGVALLDRAMRLDAGAIVPVFERLDAWRRDATVAPALAGALERLREGFAAQAASLQARDGVAEDDELVAHDLDAEGLQALAGSLRAIPQLAEAWLVRKRLDLPGEAAHYTLLVVWRGSVASETAGLKRLVAALRLPGSVTVFGDGDSGRRALARRVRAVCGAPVYRRGR